MPNRISLLLLLLLLLLLNAPETIYSTVCHPPITNLIRFEQQLYLFRHHRHHQPAPLKRRYLPLHIYALRRSTNIENPNGPLSLHCTHSGFIKPWLTAVHCTKGYSPFYITKNTTFSNNPISHYYLPFE